MPPLRGTSHIRICDVAGKRHSATGETPVVPVRRQDGGFPCGRAGVRPFRGRLGGTPRPTGEAATRDAGCIGFETFLIQNLDKN